MIWLNELTRFKVPNIWQLKPNNVFLKVLVPPWIACRTPWHVLGWSTAIIRRYLISNWAKRVKMKYHNSSISQCQNKFYNTFYLLMETDFGNGFQITHIAWTSFTFVQTNLWQKNKITRITHPWKKQPLNIKTFCVCVCECTRLGFLN